MKSYKTCALMISVLLIGKIVSANSSGVYFPNPISADGAHIRSGILINGAKANGDGTYDLYAQYRMIRNVAAEQFSLASQRSSNGVTYGFVLQYNSKTSELEHCVVTGIFQNDAILGNCYTEKNGQEHVRRELSLTHNFIPQVNELGEFKKDDVAYMKTGVRAYKKDLAVEIIGLYLVPYLDENSDPNNPQYVTTEKALVTPKAGLRTRNAYIESKFEIVNLSDLTKKNPRD